MKRIFIVMLSWGVMGAASAQTDGHRWVKFDALPTGGNVAQLDYDNSGVIYALVKESVTPKSSIFYSENNGESWTEMPGDRINNHTHIEVDKETGTLYVGTLYRGIFSTSNKGVFWKHNPIFTNPTSGLNAHVHQIAKKSGTHIVVANQPGLFSTSAIYTSTSDGLFFSTVGAPFAIAHDLKFLEDGTLLAGTEKGIFLSEDNGNNWTPKNTGMANLSVSSICEEPETGDLYIGVSHHSLLNDTTGAGIYKSTDGAATWHRISVGIPDNRVTSLALGTSGSMFAATHSGIHISTDGGLTWITNNEGLPAFNINTVITANDRLFSGSAQFGAASRSLAASGWGLVNEGMITASFRRMTMSSSTEYQILSRTMGVFRKEHSAWQQEISDFPAVTPGELLVKGNGDTLFAAFTESFNEMIKTGGLFRSTDKGVTWQLFSDNIPKPIGLNYNNYRHLVMTPSGAIYLFVGRATYTEATDYHNFDEIIKTTNGGLDWEVVYSGDIAEMDVDRNERIYIRAFDPVDFRYKYFQSDNHVDFDTTAIDIPLISPMSPGAPLELVVDNEDSLYLVDRNIIYKQTSEGWEAIPNGGWPHGAHEYYTAELTFDKSNSAYVLVNGHGLFKTSDDGLTWGDMSAGIPSYTVPVFGRQTIQIGDLNFDEENVPYFVTDFSPDSLSGIYKYTNEVLSADIPGFQSGELQVYPNPASDKVQYELKLQGAASVRIELFNTSGKLLHSELGKMTSGINRGSMDLSTLPPAIYYLRFQTNLGSKISKITKL